MRKSFTILIALVLTLFTVPFGGLTAFAGEKVYDNIKDGQYDLDIELLKEGTDEKSAAAQYMNEEASLKVEDGSTFLTFYIPENPFMKFNKFEVEEVEPVIGETTEINEETNEEKTVYTYTFELTEIKSKLHSVVSYEVPMIGLIHNDVGMDIKLLGLDQLPEKEEEPEVADDERVVGEHVDASAADSVYTVEFDSDSPATKGQLNNPVTVLVKDEKAYVQITVSDRGAPLFRSLKFNGEEVVWNSITEGPYVIQYELANGMDSIEDEIDVSMVIDTGHMVMPHDNIKLWFDEDTLEEIEADDEGSDNGDSDEAKDERVVGKLLKESDADEVYTIIYKTESRATSGQLKNPVTVLVKGEKTYIQIPINEGGAHFFRSLKFNGEEVVWNSVTEAPYLIQYELEKGFEGLGDEIDVSMVIQAGPNVMPHDNIKLSFDLDTLKEQGEGDGGSGNEEKEEPEEDEKVDEGKPEGETEVVSLTPDRVYEVMYEILNENGVDVSVADGFFTKPAYILEKDGVKYIQFTVTDGEYVKSLSNEFGNALILKENDDGSVVLQLKLHDDLSNMLLDMHIVVGAGAMPGFPGYDAKHKAILSLDLNSLREIDVADHLLAGTGDENNENGPYLKGQPKPEPEKPEFGEGKKDPKGDGVTDLIDKKDGEKNPQTGVKTNLMLYVLLLIGSLIPLTVQLKRRFA